MDAEYTKRLSNDGISALNGLIGIWLIMSPLVLAAVGGNDHARWNNMAVGVLVGVIGFIQASDYARRLWSWPNLLLGVWLVISPFTLGFAHNGIGTAHNIIIGILVGLVAFDRTRRL